MNNTRGGARPLVREDDGRGKGKPGTPRPNAGRPPQSYTLKLGDKLAVGGNDADGNGLLQMAMLWTVTKITRTRISFEDGNGNTYSLLR